ncbi:MAG: STAS domain-containing protein [Thermoanaerobaculia bacterium]
MEIHETTADDVVVLAIDGRLDTKTAHTLESKVHELLSAAQLRIVIDMASLQYLSSAGLRVLLMLGKKLNGTDNGSLALCAMNESVREVFDIAGFTSVFTICKTREEALASFRSGSSSEQVVERAAHSLGASNDSEGTIPRGDAEIDDLASRAARLLGANVR